MVNKKLFNLFLSFNDYLVRTVLVSSWRWLWNLTPITAFLIDIVPTWGISINTLAPLIKLKKDKLIKNISTLLGQVKYHPLNCHLCNIFGNSCNCSDFREVNFCLTYWSNWNSGRIWSQCILIKYPWFKAFPMNKVLWDNKHWITW